MKPGNCGLEGLVQLLDDRLAQGDRVDLALVTVDDLAFSIQQHGVRQRARPLRVNRLCERVRVLILEEVVVRLATLFL